MTEIKKRVLSFSSGKKIKLFGTCIGISPSLELSECYVPNMLSQSAGLEKENPIALNNPNRFTVEELMELADYNMRLWLEFKEKIRQCGIAPKIFNKDAMV